MNETIRTLLIFGFQNMIYSISAEDGRQLAGARVDGAVGCSQRSARQRHLSDTRPHYDGPVY